MEMGKSFSLNNGQGAQLKVKAVLQISPGRCICGGTNCAVIIGKVTAGTFSKGDKFVLVDDSGQELLKDSISRMEINRQERFDVPTGCHVGMLIKKNSADNLRVLGIPRYRSHVSAIVHPYRT